MRHPDPRPTLASQRLWQHVPTFDSDSAANGSIHSSPAPGATHSLPAMHLCTASARTIINAQQVRITERTDTQAHKYATSRAQGHRRTLTDTQANARGTNLVKNDPTKVSAEEFPRNTLGQPWRKTSRR
ncbi:hypothetical protein BaRGS_00019909 [Batillaria attramentaria]|uniref:Uncharacterized protein n=1 Tax=Batillaria attramentaria TaxID=370345 RepID=A0ABD0KNL9_9CAEN